MLQFHLVPVPEASPEVLAQATKIVNLANAAYNRLFPGDRLRPNSIAEEYVQGFLILAHLDANPVGTVTIFIQEDKIKINLLAVSREAKGQQVGANILDFVDKIGREKGLQKLWLEAVDRSNLVQYYLSIGFTEAFRTLMPIGSWGAPETFDLVTMSRPC